MANGPQVGEENFKRFQQWAAEKTDADFKAMERGGKINRAEIVKEASIGRAALNQNPLIKEALAGIEKDLRARGILPPVTEDSPSDELPMREAGAQKRMVDSAKLSRLEQDNAALRQENAELKRQLSRFTVLQEALALTGRIPR
jgi:hypothetical protein